MDPAPVAQSMPAEQKSTLSGFLLTPRGSALLISLVGILVYSNTFSSPFLFDDIHCIVEHHSLREASSLSEACAISPRRAIPYMSFWLDSRTHGFSVAGYHAVNLGIHLLAALAGWRLAALALRQSLKGSGERKLHSVAVVSLFSGLLFVAHPIQTQAVTYIVQRMTSMAALFYILAVWLYGEARRRQALEGMASQKGWSLHVLGILAAACAVHCKENAFTLPAAIVLWELCFGFRSRKTEWLLALPYALVALLIPLYVAAWKGAAGLPSLAEIARETDTVSRLTYLLTEFRVLMTYLRLLVFPVSQNLDYSYPLSRSLLEPTTFASFLALCAIGIAGIAAFPRHRIVTFCVFWFYITLSVESTIVPIKDVIFEHRLYLPMMAYAILLPFGVWLACERLTRKTTGGTHPSA